MKVFEFKVRFRNDRMGFTKAFDVEARSAEKAILAAELELHRAGYEISEFAVVELTRGREVGT